MADTDSKASPEPEVRESKEMADENSEATATAGESAQTDSTTAEGREEFCDLVGFV